MSSGPNTARRLAPDRSVFDAMNDVAKITAELRAKAERRYRLLSRDEAIWLVERVENVLATITDATVTYGFTEGGESVTPMMVERDAIVGALDAE